MSKGFRARDKELTLRLFQLDEDQPWDKDRPADQFHLVLTEYKDNLKTRPHLDTASEMLLLKMRPVFMRKATLFSIQIRASGTDKNTVSEIGIAIYDPRRQQFAINPVIRTIHIVIGPQMNSEGEPDLAKNFSGAKTYVLDLEEAVTLVQLAIGFYFEDIYCWLVGHSLKTTREWLDKLGLDFFMTPDVLDTQELFAFSHGGNASLEEALVRVSQPFAFLGNAGNDAYYTLLLALRLCDPLARVVSRVDDLSVQSKRKEVADTRRDINESVQAKNTDLEAIIDDVFI